MPLFFHRIEIGQVIQIRDYRVNVFDGHRQIAINPPARICHVEDISDLCALQYFSNDCIPSSKSLDHLSSNVSGSRRDGLRLGIIRWNFQTVQDLLNQSRVLYDEDQQQRHSSHGGVEEEEEEEERDAPKVVRFDFVGIITDLGELEIRTSSRDERTRVSSCRWVHLKDASNGDIRVPILLYANSQDDSLLTRYVVVLSCDRMSATWNDHRNLDQIAYNYITKLHCSTFNTSCIQTLHSRILVQIKSTKAGTSESGGMSNALLTPK